MKTLQILRVGFVVFLILGGAALAGNRKKAQSPPPAPFSGKVDTIAVLRVADVRKDTSVNLGKLDQIGQRAIKRALKKSTYDLVFAEDSDGVPEITEDDLEYRDDAWIRQLGPEETQYVFLIVLEDAARKKTFGTAFGTVCSAYLFDTHSGETMWQAQDTGTMGQGGLAGFAMNNLMRGGAFEDCASKLMGAFPWEKKGKPRKS